MYSFDGDFKPRRNINLGGDRQNQNKQTLLEQAREQRRLRNEQRVQNDASKKIQNAVRIFLCRRQIQRQQFEIFQSYSTSYNDMKFQNYLRSFCLSFPDPNWLLNNPNSEYHTRLSTLLPQVINVSMSTQNSHSLILSPFHLSNSIGWNAVVIRLVKYILLQSTVPKDQFEFIDMVFLGLSNLQDTSIQLDLFQACLNFRIFTHIKNLIQLEQTDQYWRQFLTIPLDMNFHNTLKHDFFNHFCRELLAIKMNPVYFKNVLNSFQTKLIKSNSATILIESFIQVIQEETIPSVEKVYMVHNLSYLIDFDQSLFTLEDSALLNRLFKAIIVNLPFESSFIISFDEYQLFQYEQSQEEGISDNEDFEETTQNIFKIKSNPMKSDHLPEKVFVDPDVLDNIKLFLVSTKILQNLTLHIDTQDETLIQFSEFITILLFKWPSLSRELISNLLYNVKFSNISLIKRLYNYWANLNLHTICTEKTINSDLFKNSSNVKHWIILVLLSECLSQHMIAIGDEESVTDLLNLKMHHLLNLTVVLRNVTFYLYWNESLIDLKSSIHGLGIHWGWLRKSLTKLVRQLYDRDSRSNFTGEEFWVAKWNSDLANVFYQNAAQELFLDSQNSDHDNEPNESKRHSSMSSLLKNIPFTLPFKERVMIFSKIIEFDRDTIPPQYMSFHTSNQVARVRRGRAFDDGFLKLNHLGDKMKGLIKIEFISELGLPEIGIDGGGVFKEFLNSVIKQAFDTNYGLFLHTPQRFLYPNPHMYASQDSQLPFYEFLGRILGKALYEGILVNAPLARFFVAKWLGQPSYFNDLPSLDPELYRGLKVLKNYQGDVEADFGLNFTLSNQEFGETSTIELIPNGINIPVTKDNRIKYTYLVADYRLNRQIHRQSAAFLKGLNDLIHPDWLKLFHATELQLLVGGQTQPIDLEDFQKNTTYSGVYDQYHPVILAFWDVVEELTQEERAKLLEFITSCPRPPMLGFAQLNPPLCIRSAGEDDRRLPTASTCVNLLKLPVFTSKATLKEKLIYAINSNSGFELS